MMNFDSCWQIIWREAVYKRMLSVSRECSLSSIVHDRIHIQEDQRTQILTPIVKDLHPRPTSSQFDFCRILAIIQ